MFPNEPKPYRAARSRLLRAEIALRRQVEKVAAMRRKLPAGGKVPQDYVFEEGDPPRQVKAVRAVRRARHAGGLQLHVRAAHGQGLPDVHVDARRPQRQCAAHRANERAWW